MATALAGLLAAAVAYSVRIWGDLGGDDVSMGATGYGALVVGVVAATVVGAGLMGLVFYSSRRGYDDDAGTDQLS